MSSYQIKTKKSEQYYELQEIKILTTSKSPNKIYYKNLPMLHIGGKRFFIINQSKWTFLTGLHLRNRYSILSGFYLGGEWQHAKNSPLVITGKISADFITLLPQFKTDWLKISYMLKMPFINPQNDLWVSSVHSLAMVFPF